jgi:chemotaxis protein methyltransferase CheR
MVAAELTEDEFQKFRDFTYRVAGIQIPPTKRVLVSNRVRRRLRATGIEAFAAYFAFLNSPAGKDELPQFLDEITTNETYFFRDTQHYDWFGDTFLPEVVSQARHHKHAKSLRVWSAACSTGEEVYSLAIKIQQRKGLLAGWKVNLLGTDISGAALGAARVASYDARALRLVSELDKTAHFDADPAQSRWTVKPELRAMATWKCHNLLKPLKEELFDCILIKNVLIYFDPVSKRKVVDNLLNALAPGGYLVVGPTEGIYGMLGSLKKTMTWLYQKTA